MRLYTYILALLLTATCGYAKENSALRKANFLYDRMAYQGALHYYLLAGVPNSDAATLARIGDCYRLTKDAQQASAWYAKATALPGCGNATKLHYAQTLMTLGQHAQAAQVLAAYTTAVPGDRRAANMLTSCQLADSMRAAAPTGYTRLLGFNGDGSEFGPALRGDELYFTADRPQNTAAKNEKPGTTHYYNIYCAGHDKIGLFDAPRQLAGRSNEEHHDGPASFDVNGDMFFTRTGSDMKLLTRQAVTDKNDVARLQIMIATDYDVHTNRYKRIMPFPYNNSNYSVAHPSISTDGKKLFFVSDMAGGQGGTDVYACERKADGSWDAPKALGVGINTEGDELFPFADVDNTLYFSSNGHVGLGGQDLYRARWNHSTHAYDTPMNMGIPVNSPYDDVSLVLATDGSVSYFASDRPADKKGDNIYSFVPRKIYLAISGTDSVTGARVGNYTMKFLGKEQGRQLAAGSDGMLVTQLYPGISYTMLITAPGYQPSYIIAGSNAITSASDTIVTTIKFNPNANISVRMAVYDEVADTAVAGARIVCYKAGQQTRDTLTLDNFGVCKKALDANSTYYFTPVKSNYQGKEKAISTAGITPDRGEVIFSEHLYLRKD